MKVRSGGEGRGEEEGDRDSGSVDGRRKGEGAQTFSLRGLRNLRLRACRPSERCENDLLDPLSLSRDAALRPGRLIDIHSVVRSVVRVHSTARLDIGTSTRHVRFANSRME